MPRQIHNFDLVIVGGGLAGASLALALAASDLKVAMIEAVAPQASEQPSYDDRTLALALTSCRIMQGLGIWDQLQTSTTAIKEIYVSELDRPTQVKLTANDLGFESFGAVIEARAIGNSLLKGLQTASNVSSFCPAKLTAIESHEEQVILQCQTDDGEIELKAGLVVAADGARSSVREMLSIPTQVHDYQQTAVIANVTPEKSHQQRAFEHFTPTGPLAILPHVDGRCGMVWTVPRGEENALLELPDQQLLDSLNQRLSRETHKLLGDFIKVGRRTAYPLYLVQPESNISKRVVLIGNAAHAIHPNSAQGFNLALRDAVTLAEMIIEAGDTDIGSHGFLNTFDQWRQPDQQRTIEYSDGLARLFANPGWLAKMLRGGGMALHQLFPPLKRRLALSAMGFRGRLPKLARGETLVGRDSI